MPASKMLEVIPMNKVLFSLAFTLIPSLYTWAVPQTPLVPEISALLTAVREGKVGTAKKAILSLKNPNVSNKDGITLLMLASYKGLLPLIDLLLAKKADVNLATIANKEFTFGRLLSNTNKGTSALMLAAWKGNLAIVQSLLLAGADVNAQDSDGQTALTYAILSHPQWPHAPLAQERLTIIKLLLQEGANPYIQDGNHLTSFYYYTLTAGLTSVDSEHYQKDQQVLANDPIYIMMQK